VRQDKDLTHIERRSIVAPFISDNLKEKVMFNFIRYCGLLMMSTIVLSGCGTSGPVGQNNEVIPSGQLSNYALVTSREFIRAIDGEELKSFGEHHEIYVTPGRHTIKFAHLADAGRMSFTYHAFTVIAGYKYTINYVQRVVEVSKIMGGDGTVEHLTWFDDRSSVYSYYDSATFKELQEQQAKKLQAAKQQELDRQQAALEKRKQNLPLVRKVGTRICQTKSELGMRLVYTGYVEQVAEEKVQIRVATEEGRRFGKAFTPSIIWDNPLNWELCE